MLKKLAVQNIEVDMARMKQAVEAACRNTTVTVLSIEHDVLDAKFFAAGEPKASQVDLLDFPGGRAGRLEGGRSHHSKSSAPGA